MFGLISAALGIFLLSVYFILWPVFDYFRDPKGLRKYPNLSLLSGVTDLAFIWEAHKGFRSNTLLKAHQSAPVIRIGPNSLSYGDVRAIKDIYGHGTKCGKDVMYSALAGTHYHLADVVDKRDHARKRKVLSSAYALKNLEGWEYKVAAMTSKMVKAFDGKCTPPLNTGHLRPAEQDLRIDYREWSNLFTIAAIANIGLSEDLGFLDKGNDRVVAERMDGTLHEVNYRQCLHATARAQSSLVWSYEWFGTLTSLSKLISPSYREMWRLNENWNDIVYHRATKRLQRHHLQQRHCSHARTRCRHCCSAC